MAGRRITLQIESKETGRPVALADFLYTLEAFREALRHADQSVTGGHSVEWRIVALSQTSPATVGVEPELIGLDQLESPPPDHRDEIVEGFFRNAESLNYNRIAPVDMDRDYLTAFRRLASPVRDNRLVTTISNGKRSIEVSGELEAIIEAILEPKTHTLGSAQGRLEYVDIHGRARVFRIYPEVGPKRIVCQFPDHLLSDAKAALGRVVRVYGEVTYLERDAFPDAVHVEEIEILPEEHTLPTLRDLYGMAPGSPDDPPAEDLVRAARDS